MMKYIRGILATLHSYFLGVVLSWAAYPVLIILTFLVSLKTSLTFYTGFSTLVLASLLYVAMHTYGEKERRTSIEESDWFYGFIYGALAFLVIYVLEVIIIALANRFMIVKHPFLAIANINSYFRLLIYMPFYWFYQLLDPLAGLVPRVNYLTALIPGVIVILASGFGYLLGFNSKTIIKFSFKSIKEKLMYKGEKSD